MQETRRRILDILKRQGQATVDDIVEDLQTRFAIEITAVTVRHHLGILQDEGYVTEPELRHRNSPGRPQYVYTLTDKAMEIFPNNYRNLVQHLIDEMENQLPPEGVNVIIDGVANAMAQQLKMPENLTLAERMDLVVEYLDGQGYAASWQHTDNGVLLNTSNCPYHQVAQTTDKLCSLDMRLVSALIGIVPRRVSSVTDGDDTCAYLIPASDLEKLKR